MKKLVTVFVSAACLLVAAGVSAQSKTGHIDMSELYNAMPEFAQADTTLTEYQQALGLHYTEMVTDYNLKDSLLYSNDTLQYSKTVLELKRKDLGLLYLKIQGWNREAQGLFEKKQTELMAPIQAKAQKAVNDVAKENGYGYVIGRQALITPPPPADDLLPLVKKKLGIK